MNQYEHDKNEAEKAKAQAEMLRANADALKKKAEYEQDFGAGEGSEATAKAWDEYQEATNAAARAEKEAKDLREKALAAENIRGIREAAKVRIRDYLLIDDLRYQAMEWNPDATFGDAVKAILMAEWGGAYSTAKAEKEAKADAWMEAWMEWCQENEPKDGADTAARDKIWYQAKSLAEDTEEAARTAGWDWTAILDE